MKFRRDPQPVLLGSLEEQVMLAVLRTGEQAYGMNVRRELETVLAIALSSGQAVGLEIAIYNPALDDDGAAGRGLADCVARALASWRGAVPRGRRTMGG